MAIERVAAVKNVNWQSREKSRMKLIAGESSSCVNHIFTGYYDVRGRRSKSFLSVTHKHRQHFCRGVVHAFHTTIAVRMIHARRDLADTHHFC